MTGASWLVDSKRIATKIKNTTDPTKVKWMSNPTKACPKCNYIIDNNDVVQDWPGLPQGVKFDPSDQELLWHLLAKAGKEGAKPHPFVNEFIPTIDKDDGICYTLPQKLPGVKQDGSVSHFFHRTFKAYNTGIRKRRKVQQQNDDDEQKGGLGGDVRWHKTGKTKPVMINGVHVGCKKIMVLYSSVKGEKAEKTNWVMHQYHLGTGEDEKDGEYVVSKVFHQPQQLKAGDTNKSEGKDLLPATLVETLDGEAGEKVEKTNWVSRRCHLTAEDEKHGECDVSKIFHQTQQLKTGDTNESEGKDLLPTTLVETLDGEAAAVSAEIEEEPAVIDHSTNPRLVTSPSQHYDMDQYHGQVSSNQVIGVNQTDKSECGTALNSERTSLVDDANVNHLTTEEDTMWWEGGSQCLLDSQQLAEGIALCDDLLQSQSSCGGQTEEPKRMRPCLLSEYARIGGGVDLKKDLEECQKLGLSHFVDHQNNIDFEHLGSPPDMRLSQLEFGSQDLPSFLL